MRVLLGVLLLASAPAYACPPGSLCLTADPAPAKVIEVALPPSPTPPPRAEARVEMPWIWQVLREQVYQRMPRIEDDRSFSLVLAPVVVRGQFDTVPGFGVAGDF